MTAKNELAKNRTFHFTYKVECSINQKIFYGFYSSNNLDSTFRGKGNLLSKSFKLHGRENHVFEILQFFNTRDEAIHAYNELKASLLINPSQPKNKKFHIVYKITRFDGMYYIGVHSTNKLNDRYMGSGSYITKSVKKYGRDQHYFEILTLCESREQAFIIESNLVNTETLKDPLCMNCIEGGNFHANRVYGYTEELKKQKSDFFKKINRTPDWCAKIGNAHRGKIQPRDAVEKQREKMKGYKWTDEQIASRVAGQLSSQKFKERYKPVIIDGIRYENGGEACTKLNIAGSTLKYRLISPNWVNYNYADKPPKDVSLVSRRARGPYNMSST